jgi:hypothetical protein
VTTVTQWELRAQFARRLSAMYGREVPAYATLVDVSREVNTAVFERSSASAERLGSIARVTAERHGAIRVGRPDELRQVARVFGVLGMYPVGFYDPREAAASAVPVISTAFRPIEAAEPARNPFRVFTSMLTPAAPRFFDDDLRSRLENFLARRRVPRPGGTATDAARGRHRHHRVALRQVRRSRGQGHRAHLGRAGALRPAPRGDRPPRRGLGPRARRGCARGVASGLPAHRTRPERRRPGVLQLSPEGRPAPPASAAGQRR